MRGDGAEGEIARRGVAVRNAGIDRWTDEKRAKKQSARHGILRGRREGVQDRKKACGHNSAKMQNPRLINLNTRE